MLYSRFKGLAPWLQPYADWLWRWAQLNGLRPIVTSVYRSDAHQATLYDRYRRGLSDLPAAPPGRSKHGKRLAFDMVVMNDYRSSQQAAVGAVWQRMGGRWFASDPVHFEV